MRVAIKQLNFSAGSTEAAMARDDLTFGLAAYQAGVEPVLAYVMACRGQELRCTCGRRVKRGWVMI